ncbi:MAG TPA: ATP-dependent DNA ligase [Gemmataceae bacterium]|jgi:DNA ligase-1|nr:ATP-dependent DNA ligase [Gemmataceae bacterium]
MKAFADLYAAIDATTKTTAKVEAMVHYFETASAADAAWAVYFLSGRKPRQAVPTRKLQEWAAEIAGIPNWLFEESRSVVGDLAESIALVLPAPKYQGDRPLAEWVGEVLLTLREADEQPQKAEVLAAWASMDYQQAFVWNKLITGAFRVGVSQLLVTRALSRVSGVPAEVIAHRLMGEWQPTPAFFAALIARDAGDADISKPYPFCLAHALDCSPADLGDIGEWQAEWKWDGIRSQLIRRAGQTFVWSRGEELVTERYPELKALGELLPDGTVIDGEILPWKAGRVLPFGELQRRIGRKTIGKKLLEEVPVALMGYDLIEWQGRDVRQEPMTWRREQLEQLASVTHSPTLILSALVVASSWNELAAHREGSRDRNVEGLMLKRKASHYRVGRVTGDWWKWKIGPLTIDAVLIYAQGGSGKRAGLFTDYTFGVWDAGKLVPVAKAYSGLTDAEIKLVDTFVRKNTLETFGPVRTVKPELVFELGFEGIQPSTRHKSGIAVRFPRMLRWRTDKKAEEADSLAAVKKLLPEGGG